MVISDGEDFKILQMIKEGKAGNFKNKTLDEIEIDVNKEFVDFDNDPDDLNDLDDPPRDFLNFCSEYR